MKKIASVIIFSVFFVTCYMLHVSFVYAEGIVKGERAENIDGMLHKVEYLYGSAKFNNLDSMIKGLNTIVYKEDRISYFPDPSYGIGSRIIIQRANPVKVTDAGTETTLRTWKNNVKDILDENRVELGTKDVVDPALDTKIDNINSQKGIVITRVAETEMVEKKDIDFKIVTKKDPNMYRGDSKVDQQGKKGIKEYTYLVRRENGKEVSRKLIKTEITKDPVDKITVEGTKVMVYGTGTATWYASIGGMTAAHNTLPYGTMVHVVNTANGKTVDVKIVDHGIQGSAIIDLSNDAFKLIAPLGQGVVSVRLEKP